MNISHIYTEENYIPKELSLYIYSDGIAEVEYKLDVDPTLARVNITLFGKIYENFIVEAQNILLDFEIYDGYATIDVLGSHFIEITYLTSDLTYKTESTWSLILYTPIVVNIHLPSRSTIISLDPTPLVISFLGDSVSLTMPEGEIQIIYTLGVVGTKEHALALINDVEEAIEEIKAEGIIVGDAETLLSQAREAYEGARYVEAEQFADQAKTSAVETEYMAQEANTTLDTAESAIDSALNAGRTSLLVKAREEQQQAYQAYDLGDYERAKNLAEQAIITANLSKSTAWFSNPYLLVSLGIVVIAFLIITFIFSRGKLATNENETGLVVDKYNVKLDSLFEEHPHLRIDEKEVIRYISESGGGIFVSELRQRFNMPKSSAWRMVRRLKAQEIIETKIVGRESFVQISLKYRLKD